MSSPASSPKVVRAARTYGRRKQTEPLATENAFTIDSRISATPGSTNTSPTHSISLDDIPPSSDDAGLGDASVNEDDDSHSEPEAQTDADDDMDDVEISGKYTRHSLKDALARIDREFDDEDMDVEPMQSRRPGLGIGEKSRSLSKENASRSTLDEPFDDPADSTSNSHLFERNSTSPSLVARRTTKPTRYINDSDESAAEHAQTSPHTSPEDLHPINTPNTRSSPTPPTSQEMAPAVTKGKGKARERDHSHSRNNSDDLLPTVHSNNKRKKKGSATRTAKQTHVKAPSKKELLETQKATVRIKAEQRPTLPRHENRLKISSLFEKISSGLRGLPAREPPSNDLAALPSDPIQPCSSSPARLHENSFTARPSSLRPQTLRSSLTTKFTNNEFVPSGLLGGDEDEAKAPSSSKQPCTPSRAQDRAFRPNGLLDAYNDTSEDEEMPTVGQIVSEVRKKKEQTEAQRKLHAAKLQYLQKQQHVVDDADDSDLEVVDDDMHTVAKEEDNDRRARKAKHITESLGRQKQLTQAGKARLIRSPNKTSTLREGKRDLEILAAAAVPSFSSEALPKVRKGKGRESSRVNQNDLNKLLLHASDKQSRELAAQKEAEFSKKIGQRREEPLPVDKAAMLDMLARKGMQNRTREDSSDGDDEDQGDGENDSDWTPEVEARTDDDGATSEGAYDLPIATDDDSGPLDDDDENDENVPMRATRIHARPRAVVDSDSDGENNRPLDTGRVLVAGSSLVLGPVADPGTLPPALNHRGSVSSLEERLEEGTDKENDFRLSFDRGEDKENTAVASENRSAIVSPLAALRGGSGIFSLQSLGRTPSSSAVLGLSSPPLEEDRAPLQEIPTGDDDDDVFLSPSTRQASTRPSSSRSPMPSQSLSPLQFRSSDKGQGLSTFFDDEEPAGENSKSGSAAFSLEPAADIRPGGLSQFFAASGKSEATSPAPLNLGKSIGFSQFMTPSKPLAGPLGARGAASDEFTLTLGQSLQPALEVDESLLRQADNIFEKEQGFIVGEATIVPKSAAKPLFVNRHGFLTQTKPPSSPASPAFLNIASSVVRQPLSTIALSRMTEDEEEDDEEEEENLRPRRLRRRSSSPEQLRGYRSSVSPSPVKPRNAFDLLGHKPARLKAPQFEKKRLEKNEFIEGEAEESDEDAAFGFGLPKKKDDEEDLDGEDQDRILEELVDDAHMDDDTLNEEKVMEKVQEHREMDDAADEKIARDAAEGKMRIKRRNNLLDDDDDESDDESWEAKRARERIAKKRRIEGDTLEQIEKNPETRAFAAAYAADDDENEFAHLDHEDSTLVGIPDSIMDEGDEDEEDDDDREVVDAVALREQLQRVARGEETVETIDVNDVGWLDADDDDMDNVLGIKEVNTAHRKGHLAGETSNEMDWDLMQQRRRDLDSEDLARQQKWARSEGGTRNIGTGRASAVTGMSKPTKTASGSMVGRRKGLGESSAAPSTQSTKKVAKAPSALSAVSGRRARFAN